MTAFLTLDDLIAVATSAVGPDAQIVDYGLLESALARPQATVFGDDAYPTLTGKAAALLSSLVRNHALVDGNKRLGWVATRLFLVFNDHDLRAPEQEAFELVMGIADGSMVDVDKIAAVLQGWLRQLDS